MSAPKLGAEVSQSWLRIDQLRTERDQTWSEPGRSWPNLAHDRPRLATVFWAEVSRRAGAESGASLGTHGLGLPRDVVLLVVPDLPEVVGRLAVLASEAPRRNLLGAGVGATLPLRLLVAGHPDEVRHHLGCARARARVWAVRAAKAPDCAVKAPDFADI